MAANLIELLEEFKIPRISGPNGQKFIGTVFAVVDDMLVEAAATAVRAPLLYDVNPRPPDESGEQPLLALDLLGRECGRPHYPGESYASLLSALRGKWTHYQQGIKQSLIDELTRAGVGTVSIEVPKDLDLTPIFAAASFSISPAAASWPSGHLSGDVGLLIIETANEAVATAPEGWVRLVNVGVGTAGGASATRLTIFKRQAESDDEADVTLTSLGDHLFAVIVSIRGADPDAIDVATATSADADETAVSVVGGTSQDAQALSIFVVTNQTDTNVSQASAFANAALTDVTEQFDVNSSSANGGGGALATGKLAEVGASGTWTATLATPSRWAAAALTLYPLQYWSRFWVDIADSPLTGPGISWGVHRVGIDRLGPAGMTPEYYGTLRKIVRDNKPSQWIPWEYRFAVDGGTVHLQLGKVVDPAWVYFTT